MRILFMGTPDFAVPSLDLLNKHHDIVGVFTKIDKPNMRGKKIKFTPVKEYALENEITVYQPNSVRTEETLNLVKEINPDLIVVVAYGKILPKELIDIPKYGVINVHSSLLPKYRGAAPIHAAIINGDTESGVSIMYIAEELDAGDVILQGKTTINEEDTLETLHDRLMDIGAKTLLEAVDLIEEEKAPRIPQNHEEATFVRPFKKEDCEINWEQENFKIYNFVRGMNPFPSAHTYSEGKMYKIYKVEKISREYEGEPGEIVELLKGRGPVVKTGNGSLIITEAKPENKKKLTGSDLVNGNYFNIGGKFENSKIK
ncbi:methionyl-tRNA formyltransferase [uncultured Ilyobacter sp.]|uniref:methionyl-tRNA formyltransferase n=1 Tax=uncultured Ilyobacter sp. TaxID=544433 RepID=UPI0029C720E6|nr:methionyl-tRNA formyltransferase [uncultured Ilyobacter sp.]